MVSHLSSTAWRATTTTLGAIALASTIFRIYHRYRKLRLWWDDYWAVLSQFCNLIYATTVWVRDDDIHPHHSVDQRIRVFWLSTLTFPVVVWSARISIAMSIARLAPKVRMRQLMYALSALFGLILAGLLFYRIILCSRTRSWHHNPTADCYMGNAIGIVSICTDIPGDICLVVIPMHMLWRVRLPRRQKHLLLAIFSASTLSSLVGIIYAIFMIRAQTNHTPWTRLTGLMANIKAAVTLLVCNLLVVATYVYCLFLKDEDEKVSEPSATRSKPTAVPPSTIFSALTVVSDLDVLDSDISSGHPNSNIRIPSSNSTFEPDHSHCHSSRS